MSDDDLTQVAALGRQFASLATSLSSPDESPVDAGRVARLAVRALPEADACGVTLLRDGHRGRSLGGSHSLADEVDSIQFATRQGPCLRAAKSDTVAVSGDLATDDRWPDFARQCVATTGVQSILSVRLPLAVGDHAALNFYSRQPDAFGELDVAMASMFVPFAALAVEHELRTQDADNFRAALSSSRQIGTAIGILMARSGASADEAFQQLRSASQHLNRKLRDIAAEVEEKGELPVVAAKSQHTSS